MFVKIESFFPSQAIFGFQSPIIFLFQNIFVYRFQALLKRTLELSFFESLKFMKKTHSLQKSYGEKIELHLFFKE